MSNKHSLKANFAVDKKYEAFYTGGKVQLSRDGAQMLCKCTEKLNLLDVTAGTVQHVFGQEGDGEISSYILSPDDKILVIAMGNLLLKQWDFQTRELSRTWKAIHTAPVSTMAFDSTSTLLATGGSDSTIKVWDVIQQYCTHNLRGHQGVITAVSFHPEPEKLQLFSAGEDYKIRVWDLKTSNCLSILDGHYSVITSLQFSPECHTLYSGGRDKVVIVWNLHTFTKTRTIPVYETVESVILLDKDEDYSALNVSTASPHFITAGSKGVLRVWNATSSQCVFTQQRGVGDAIKQESEDDGTDQSVIADAIHCPATRSIAVITYDHNICLYHNADLSTKKQFAGYNDEILDMRLLGVDESHLAVVTNSPLIKVFELATWDVQILRGHSDIVLALDVYHKGTLFASSSKDNTIRLWRFDPDTSRVLCVASAYGHTHEILAVAFSKLTADFVVSGSQDLTMKVWTVPSEISADTFVSLNARATEKAHDKDINSIVVSPNDKIIATGSQDKTAKLWSADTLKLLGVFRGHKRGIWCVQFSPVDQCLATASSDCTVKIWTLSDYSCVKTFEGHDALVLKVHFLTRGMQLITSGSDGLMKLWTIKTSECVKTLDEHSDRIWALTVNKAQDRLISGGGDSTIIVWKDVTETEYEEQRDKQIDVLLKEQKLNNLIQQKKFLKALTLAITLEKPFRVLNIIKEILGEPEGQRDLETTLAKLRADQLDAVLRFSVQWNTNSKHCHVAQHVLSTVIRTMPPERLLALPNARSALEGLLPYTEKHLQRMNRLLQQAMFVEYTWQTMRLASGGPSEDSRVLSAVASSHKLTWGKRKVLAQESDSSSTDEETREGTKRPTMKRKPPIPARSDTSQSDDSDKGSPLPLLGRTSARQQERLVNRPTAMDSSDDDEQNMDIAIGMTEEFGSNSHGKNDPSRTPKSKHTDGMCERKAVFSDKENEDTPFTSAVKSAGLEKSKAEKSKAEQKTPNQTSSHKKRSDKSRTDIVKRGRKLELKSDLKRKRRKSDFL